MLILKQVSVKEPTPKMSSGETAQMYKSMNIIALIHRLNILKNSDYLLVKGMWKSSLN